MTGSDVDRGTGTGGVGDGPPGTSDQGSRHAGERAIDKSRETASGDAALERKLTGHSVRSPHESSGPWWGGERPADDDTGGGSEGPPIRKGGPYSPNAAPKHRAPFRAPSAPLTYLDFLHKGVGTSDDGWGGNNPRATPGVGKGDLFRPADDAVGPYNPKGTDYRPAPDDPNPGGPAGASGRAARVRGG